MEIKGDITTGENTSEGEWLVLHVVYPKTNDRLKQYYEINILLRIAGHMWTTVLGTHQP